MACFCGMDFIVPQILQIGVNVNCNYMGVTPLSAAAEGGHKNICELLIAHGADVNLKNVFGDSPLMCAVLKGRFEVCEVLIQSGADVTAKTNAGMNALLRAAQEGHKDICELLITHGTNDICNAFSHSILSKKREVCEFFIANKVEVNSYHFYLMEQNGWFEICLKLKREKAFQRRKHLVDFYYSFLN